MFRYPATMGSIVFAFTLLTATESFAVPLLAQCIGKHCAIVVPAPFPAFGIVAATGLGPVPVVHPAVGIYCIEPSVIAVHPYVPLVTVDDDLSLPPFPGAGVVPADGIAEINHAAAACPAPPAGKPPFLEVDTYAILPGAAPPVVVPSDTVAFDIQF